MVGVLLVSGVAAALVPAPAPGASLTASPRPEGGGVFQGLNGSSQLNVTVRTSPSPPTGSAPLSLSLMAFVSGGTPPYGVNWNFGDKSPVGQGLNVSHTYPAGNFTACAMAYDSHNVSGTACIPVSATGGNGTTNNGTGLTVNLTTSPSSAGGPAPLTVAFAAAASGGAAPYNYSWKFGDGGVGAGTPNVTHVYNTQGKYNASVLVTDAHGASAGGWVPVLVGSGRNGSGNLTLSVSTSPSPPNGPVPLTVSFSGTVSGGTMPYGINWNFGDGTPWGQGMRVQHTYQGAGVYLACGYAYDATNASATQCVNVTVTGGNGSLSVGVQAHPTNGSAPLSVEFWANVTGGVAPYTYAWSFGDGGNGSGSPIFHTYSVAGTYTAVVQVADSNLTTGKARVTVTVGNNSSASPLAASLSLSPSGGVAPLHVLMGVQASGGTPKYSLRLSTGLGNLTFGHSPWSGSLVEYNVTYTSPGLYNVTAYVVDSSGAVSTASKVVDVGSGSMSVSVYTTPDQGRVPLNVTFDIGQVTGGVGPYSMELSFGDGSAAVGVIAGEALSHVYDHSGTFQFVLNVTDSQGATAQMVGTIVVSGSSTPNSGIGLQDTEYALVAGSGGAAAVAIGYYLRVGRRGRMAREILS